jgi:molybdopterin converting factor subunit 1
MPTLTVRYFAIFREQAGCESEQIETSANTPSDLYDELRPRHGFTVPKDALRAAINNEFVPMHGVVKDGDVVAFIAPVAGG